MSAALRSDSEHRDPRFPSVVLVGPPTLTRRRLGRERQAPLQVIGSDWRNMTIKMADACANGGDQGRNGNGGGGQGGVYLACGCPSSGCGCGMEQAAKDYAQPRCNPLRKVAITITNAVVVAAGAAGTATFAPQAPFKIRALMLTAAQSTDFTAIGIAVGDRPNILPGPLDGTYFSLANAQDDDGFVDSPICYPGQLIVVSFTSAAGVAALAARITVKGIYAAQLT